MYVGTSFRDRCGFDLDLSCAVVKMCSNRRSVSRRRNVDGMLMCHRHYGDGSECLLGINRMCTCNVI